MIVVYAFLRDWRATVIPAIAVPLSLLGAMPVMYLFGFSLDNLSLMALTVATGFVVDDAIVVLENVKRHMEAGMSAPKAAYASTRETAATIVSMSLSLVVVFTPILFMDTGRMFREFAVVIGASILASPVVALTVTPMLCSRLLKSHATVNPDGESRVMAAVTAGL